MFNKLINKTKFTEEDLIKELTNQVFTIEKIDKIYSQLDIDLNSIYYKDEHVLHYCCKKDLFQSVSWLIEHGVSPEIQNSQNETAIFYAILGRSSATIQTLIEHGANINHLNIYKRTVLQDAIIGANNRVVNFLLSISRNVGNCDIYGNNLIFDAISNGNIDIIQKVATLKEVNINQINNDGDCILHKELVLKNSELAIFLMEQGANPSILNKDGMNFAFLAIEKGVSNLEAIEKAVKLGFNLNTRNNKNKTLLLESINYYLNTSKNNIVEKNSHFEMIKGLIRLGINVQIVDDRKESALFKATKAEDVNLINLLIENNHSNLNIENVDGETLLSMLVLGGIKNNDIIKKLLEKGADPTIENSYGKSVIEFLIDIILHIQNRKELNFDYEILLNDDGEYPFVLENLLKNSIFDINKLNSAGEPMFFQSILHFNFNLFKILRIKNINLNQKDKDGNNIIFKLMEYNYANKIKDKKLYLNTLKSLVNAGVDINAKNNEGSTALHIAVGEKCEYTIRLLLELKADCLAVDKKGRTIMHNCIWKNTTKYFKLLHQYNKDILDVPDAFGIRPINYAAFMGKKDLVIEMLDEGALVNNPTTKDPKILTFLEKYHQNIVNILQGVDKELDKVNLRLLMENMIKEFDIKI